MLTKIWKATFILIGFNLLIEVIDRLYLEQRYEFSVYNYIIGSVASFLVIFLSVYLIELVKDKNNKTTTFGYIWRSLISFNLALILAVLLKVIIGWDHELPSIKHTFALLSLQVPFMIVLTWLFYSTNRKLQLVWLSQAVRGG